MKLLNLLKYVLVGISFVIVLAYFLFMPEDSVDLMLYWAYILFVASLVVALVFSLIAAFQNPKGGVRILIGIAAAAVVCGICYALGSDTPVIGADGNVYDSPALLKMTDMGIYICYLSMTIAVIAIVYGEIRNSFK